MWILKKINWFISNQVGINIRLLLLFPIRLLIYLWELIRFRCKYKGKVSIMPCLHDKYQEGGLLKNDYFWLDLIVAREIYKANPIKHIDIGSRIDGFVAHVASFREIEVFDIRPISAQVPGVKFIQADLLKFTHNDKVYENSCDSLSCLHAIEHFGLGRYGDPIAINGWENGILNITKMLRSGGLFYLSAPIGEERVEFNANYVLNPFALLKYCKSYGLNVEKIMIIDYKNGATEVTEENLKKLDWKKKNDKHGIFIFRKSLEYR